LENDARPGNLCTNVFCPPSRCSKTSIDASRPVHSEKPGDREIGGKRNHRADEIGRVDERQVEVVDADRVDTQCHRSPLLDLAAAATLSDLEFDEFHRRRNRQAHPADELPGGDDGGRIVRVVAADEEALGRPARP